MIKHYNNFYACLLAFVFDLMCSRFLHKEKGSLCSDEVHLTFTLEKLRALVDSLFDKQRFSTVVRELGEVGCKAGYAEICELRSRQMIV